MRHRRWWLLAIAVAVVAAGGLVGDLGRPPNDDFPLESRMIASPGLPEADAAYYGELAPLVRAASDEAFALVALGERRERNLLTIRAAQGRMEERLRAVEAFIAARPSPARFVDALTTFGDGAVIVRAAMNEARAGFLRFDWERVARATALMEQGATVLVQANGALDRAVGVGLLATPAGRPE